MTKKSIQAKMDRPILFRTVSESVYKSSIETGSIWLRSSEYYRNIEDEARVDKSEGVNVARCNFPLNFYPETAQGISLQGNGGIGCEIVPHYIMSLHGTSISDQSRSEFGGRTMGIRCIADLSADILYQVSKQITVSGYRFGQVSYQYTSMCMSHHMNTAAIKLSGNPHVAIKSINTDVLRKNPVEPFISQDEWRITILTVGYLNGDFNAPLKINVDPSHFYDYI
jgi:hypothetical protein